MNPLQMSRKKILTQNVQRPIQNLSETKRL